MAPLTWKNIDAPNFSGANASMQTAATLLSNGIGGFSEALKGYQDTRRRTATNAALGEVNRLQTSGGLQEALMNGSLNPDPGSVDPKFYEYAANAAQRVLNQEQTSANTNRIQQTTNFEAQDQANKQKLWARSDSEYAGQAPALRRALEINSLVQSGDPQKIAQGRQLELDSADIWSGAGMKYDDALRLTQTNQAAAETGMRFNRDVEADKQWWDNNDRTLDSEAITNYLIQTSSGPEDAAQRVRQLPGLDSRVTQKVLGNIQDRATNFPEVSEVDQLLMEANPQAAMAGGMPQVDQGLAQMQLRGSSTVSGQGQRSDPSGWLKYQNSGSKRSLPLSDRLVETMSFLPQMGVTMRVTSGGQSSAAEFAAGKGQSNSRTGSVRHDYGDAGDVQFEYQGRTLSWEKDADIPVLQTIIREGMGRGLQGVGGASAYMGGTTTHIGFGKRAVWGGNGDKAYPALVEAFNGAAVRGAPPAVQKQYGEIVRAASSGKNYEAPIDVNRPQINNADGTVSTEETITSQIDGTYFNIPTIFNGERHSEEEAVAAFQRGENPAVGAFQELRAAEAAAEARTEEIGKKLADETTRGQAAPSGSAQPVQAIAPAPVVDGAAPVNQALQQALAPTQVPAANSTDYAGGLAPPGGPEEAQAAAVQALLNTSLEEQTRTATSPVPQQAAQAQQAQTPVQEVLGGIQTLSDTSAVDQTFNTTEALINTVTNRPDRGKSAREIINAATGDSGSLAGVPNAAATAALSEMEKMMGGKIAPDIAVAIMAENVEARSMDGWIWDGDEFGSATDGGSMGPRINMKGVQNTIDKLLTIDPDTKEVSLQPGVGEIQTQRSVAASNEKLGKLQEAVKTSQQRIITAQRQAGRIGPQRAQQIIQEEIQKQSAYQALMLELGAAPSMADVFSRTGVR